MGLPTFSSMAGPQMDRLRGTYVAPLRVIPGDVPRFSPDDADVAVWRDRRGRPVGYGFRRGEVHWQVVERVGAYCFPAEPSSPDVIEVGVVPLPKVSYDVLDDFFLRSVLPMAAQVLGYETLHASAVVFEGDNAVALFAGQGSGKSTTAFALARHGARQVADDNIILRPATQTIIPMPYATRLRRQSAAHFGSAAPKSNKATSAGWNRRLDVEYRLAAMVLLDRGPSDVKLTRITGADALGHLLREAYSVEPFASERRRTLVANYSRLADQVPLYRLSYPNGLENLSAIFEPIASLASEPRPRATSGLDERRWI